MRKIDPILDRLKSIYNVKTRIDLAKKLKIGLSTYDNWAARDNIPDKHVRLAAEDKGVHLTWLYTGEGEKYKTSMTPGQSLFSPETLSKLSHIAETMPTYGKHQASKKLCASFDALEDDKKDEVLKELLPIIMKHF